MLTENVLGLLPGPDGSEVSGFEVGGLWTGPYPAIGEPAPPVELWPPGTSAESWRMHGPGWVAPLWRFEITTWPSPEDWRDRVRATLERMESSGAAIAWMANDLTFADPPGLFDPTAMGDQVFAAISPVTGFVCSTEMGQSVAWLPPEVQHQLHLQAVGLVDLSEPDPDDPMAS